MEEMGRQADFFPNQVEGMPNFLRTIAQITFWRRIYPYEESIISYYGTDHGASVSGM